MSDFRLTVTLLYATLVYRNFLKDLSSRESLETAVPEGHRP